MLIVIVINVFLVSLLLQFIIIPYLVKAGNIQDNSSLNLYGQALSIVPVAKKHTVVYL